SIVLPFSASFLRSAVAFCLSCSADFTGIRSRLLFLFGGGHATTGVESGRASLRAPRLRLRERPPRFGPEGLLPREGIARDPREAQGRREAARPEGPRPDQ